MMVVATAEATSDMVVVAMETEVRVAVVMAREVTVVPPAVAEVAARTA